MALKSAQGTTKPKSVAAITFDLDLKKHSVLGEESAAVTIVEFSDFECPFCARFHQQTFPKIKKEYVDTGKVNYILKDYPLGFHAKAMGAAIAANCGAEQGAYWEMKTGLFDNQRQLNQQLYSKLAKENNLDMQKFETCLKNPEMKAKVDESIKAGQNLSVNGTPHFFIGTIKAGKLVNVRRVAGAQPYASFSKVIDSLLK